MTNKEKYKTIATKLLEYEIETCPDGTEIYTYKDKFISRTDNEDLLILDRLIHLIDKYCQVNNLELHVTKKLNKTANNHKKSEWRVCIFGRSVAYHRFLDQAILSCLYKAAVKKRSNKL